MLLRAITRRGSRGGGGGVKPLFPPNSLKILLSWPEYTQNKPSIHHLFFQILDTPPINPNCTTIFKVRFYEKIIVWYALHELMVLFYPSQWPTSIVWFTLFFISDVLDRSPHMITLLKRSTPCLPAVNPSIATVVFSPFSWQVNL